MYSKMGDTHVQPAPVGPSHSTRFFCSHRKGPSLQHQQRRAPQSMKTPEYSYTSSVVTEVEGDVGKGGSAALQHSHPRPRGSGP